MAVARSWFHGIALDQFGQAIVTPGSFILGLVTSALGGWLVGYVLATG